MFIGNFRTVIDIIGLNPLKVRHILMVSLCQLNFDVSIFKLAAWATASRVAALV